MSYLQLRRVEKTFGTTRVIKGVNLTIEKGEFVVFVGPSGCGKSTLLRMIAGLTEIDGGSIELALAWRRGGDNPVVDTVVTVLSSVFEPAGQEELL